MTFTDSAGKRRDVKRRARSESHTKTLIRQILNELDAAGERVVVVARTTFAQLADFY